MHSQVLGSHSIKFDDDDTLIVSEESLAGDRQTDIHTQTQGLTIVQFLKSLRTLKIK